MDEDSDVLLDIKHQLIMYMDYPPQLSRRFNPMLPLADAALVVKEVLEAVGNIYTESHLAGIPVFVDRIQELIMSVIEKCIEDNQLNLSVYEVQEAVCEMVRLFSEFVPGLLRAFVPATPDMFFTTMVEVDCEEHQVLINLHY